MKRAAIFAVLGPVLFVLCVWFLFLPVAVLVEGSGLRFDLEVNSYSGVCLGLMVGGLALAAADWLADMLGMRPWFTAVMGWAIGAVLIGAWFDLSRPVWWWFIVKGLLVGVPALACSLLVMKTGRAGRP